MKPFLLPLLASLALPLGAAAQTSGAAPADKPFNDAVQGYKLKWADEFNDASLDMAKWVYRTDSKHWSTQLPENVSVSDGKLKIALKKESANGKNYTGGGVISKEAFQYGYYEASFKVPPGSGWHTSFWSQNYDSKGGTGTGTARQEIDFCEQDSVKMINYSAGILDWSNHGKGYGRKYVNTPDLGAAFHVWACEFTPDTVRFFFDGKLTHETDATKFKHGPANVWLTCISSPLGGTHGVADKSLPATAEFDYVRFYEKAP